METTQLFSIPLVVTYIGFVDKKRMYAYGGVFGIIAMFLTATYAKTTFFVHLIEEYVPWISGRMVLWSLYFIFVVAFTIFIINCYRAEKSGKYSTKTRDDFLKIFKPTITNAMFWGVIILLNLGACILERGQ